MAVFRVSAFIILLNAGGFDRNAVLTCTYFACSAIWPRLGFRVPAGAPTERTEGCGLIRVKQSA